MSSPQGPVAAYIDAWNTPDDARRRALLERAWADDGTYTDPTARVAGRAALHAHIGGFQRIFLALLIAGLDRHNAVTVYFEHFQFRAAFTRLHIITDRKHITSSSF